MHMPQHHQQKQQHQHRSHLYRNKIYFKYNSIKCRLKTHLYRNQHSQSWLCIIWHHSIGMVWDMYMFLSVLFISFSMHSNQWHYFNVLLLLMMIFFSRYSTLKVFFIGILIAHLNHDSCFDEMFVYVCVCILDATWCFHDDFFMFEYSSLIFTQQIFLCRVFHLVCGWFHDTSLNYLSLSLIISIYRRLFVCLCARSCSDGQCLIIRWIFVHINTKMSNEYPIKMYSMENVHINTCTLYTHRSVYRWIHENRGKIKWPSSHHTTRLPLHSLSEKVKRPKHSDHRLFFFVELWFSSMINNVQVPKINSLVAHNHIYFSIHKKFRFRLCSEIWSLKWVIFKQGWWFDWLLVSFLLSLAINHICKNWCNCWLSSVHIRSKKSNRNQIYKNS